MAGAVASIFAVVVVVLFYFVLGPLLVVVGARIFLWLSRVFELPDAIGVFGAEVRRSFHAHAATIDRDLGPPPGRTD